MILWHDWLVALWSILCVSVFGVGLGHSFIAVSVCLFVPLTFLILVPTPALIVTVMRVSSLALAMPRRSTGASVVPQLCRDVVWRWLLSLFSLMLWRLLDVQGLILPSSSTPSSTSSLSPLLSPSVVPLATEKLFGVCDLSFVWKWREDCAQMR